MTDESIRRAVAEFKAESADFASPRAEAEWGRIADWDVSGVRSMRRLFNYAGRFRGDLSLWEVGACVDMRAMFQGARAFEADLSAWSVGAGTKTTKTPDMFAGARAFDVARHAPWFEGR